MSEEKPVVEEQIVPDEPGYEYKELHSQSLRDVLENTSETPQEPEEKIKKEEEKSEETPVVEEQKPAIDPEELSRRVAEETAQRIIKEQEEKNTPAPVEDPNKRYDEWEKKFTEDNGRPPTYKEALELVKADALDQIRKEQEQRIQQETDARNKAEQERIENNKRIADYVENEFKELYTRKLLTPIKDKTNPQDAGELERQAFSKVWQEVNQARMKEGKPEIMSATEIYYNYFKKPSTEVPGADAPVAGNKKNAVPPPSQKEYTYQELKKPWRLFRR